MLVKLLACGSAGVSVLLLSGCCCCIPIPGPRARIQGGTPPAVGLPEPPSRPAPPGGWLSARGRLREGVRLYRAAGGGRREYGTVTAVRAGGGASRAASPAVLVSQEDGRRAWKELESGVYFVRFDDPALRPAR